MIKHQKNLKEQVEKYKVIFWDFDGVIKESNEVKIEAYGRLFESFGEKVRNDIVHNAKMNEGISRFVKIPLYFEKYVHRTLENHEVDSYCEQYSEMTKNAVLETDWVGGVMDYISNSYDKQEFYIVTGTAQADIDWIVDQLSIRNMFKGVFGSPDSKKDIIINLITHYQYSTNLCLMIGDSLTDYRAALDTGIDFLLRVTNHNKEMTDINCLQLKDFREII